MDTQIIMQTMAAHMESLRSELGSMRSNLNELRDKTTYDSRIDALTERLDHLNEKIYDIEKTFASLFEADKIKHENLDEKFKDAMSKLVELAKDVRTINTYVDDRIHHVTDAMTAADLKLTRASTAMKIYTSLIAAFMLAIATAIGATLMRYVDSHAVKPLVETTPQVSQPMVPPAATDPNHPVRK